MVLTRSPQRRKRGNAGRQSNKIPHRRREKRRHLHDTLRKMILSGECPPGSRLMQNELAAELGTSVNTVREALFEFRYVGLVEKREGLGFFVRELSCDDFIEARELYTLHQGFANPMTSIWR